MSKNKKRQKHKDKSNVIKKQSKNSLNSYREYTGKEIKQDAVLLWEEKEV